MPQLGLPLSAGCATRRSRCYALLRTGLRRRGRGLARVAGARGGGRARETCRSCTWRGPANGGSTSTRCRGCPATRTRRRCAWGNAAARCQVQLDVYGEVHGRVVRRAQGRPRVRRTAAGRSSARWCGHLGGDLERARRRHSGKCAASPALHALEGDGLGRTLTARGLGGHRVRAPSTAWSSHWREVRDAIHAQVCARGFDAQQNSFVQSYGSSAPLRCQPAADRHRGASRPPEDARIPRHSRRDREGLAARRTGCCATTPATRRTACRPARARSWRAASGWPTTGCCRIASRKRRPCSTNCSRTATDVGLLAEEYDPVAKRQLGNFPQAFSHLALINTATGLAAGRAGTAHQRAAGERGDEVSGRGENRLAVMGQVCREISTLREGRSPYGIPYTDRCGSAGSRMGRGSSRCLGHRRQADANNPAVSNPRISAFSVCVGSRKPAHAPYNHSIASRDATTDRHVPAALAIDDVCSSGRSRRPGLRAWRSARDRRAGAPLARPGARPRTAVARDALARIQCGLRGERRPPRP